MQHAAARLRTLLLLLLAGAVAACGEIAPATFSGDVDQLLEQGEDWGDALQRQREEELSDSEVLALSYLERARLGLGSPFRLVEYALRDPGLDADDRPLLAYALLDLTLERRGYQLEPRVLDAARLSGVSPVVGSGEHHLRLIEQVVARAPTANSGERAVRLGYELAAAEYTVAPAARSLSAHVAALVADRRRAREDVVRLLRAAVARDADPLALLPQWRRERRFEVEAPAMAQVGVREEQAEALQGPGLALALRTLAQRLSAPITLVPDADRTGRPRSFLPPDVAERLLQIARRQDYPAQAPAVVALHVHRQPLLERPELLPWQREAREAFADSAHNEVRLVAGAARLRAQGAAPGARLPLIELQAATFFRAWNQEEPWFPGDPAPTARDLEGRFGLADITLDPALPEAWRAYYLRMLGRGLADLQRVLPTASLRGLTLHVGPLPPEVQALAMHEPRSRTLYFPPRTGAGALAHEVAHDLDWQLARRRYGSRRGYATDLAVQHRPGDRIATAVADLASSLSRRGADTIIDPHDSRPAEVFARGTDWFVAAALAREGRTSGYLTSYQSAVLTGYGTTRNPDVGGAAVPSLFGILDAVAPVTDEMRRWALAAHGPGRTLSPLELGGAIVRAGDGRPAAARLAAIAEARAASLRSMAAEGCRAAATGRLRELYGARRDLIDASAQAAARGAVIEQARSLARERRDPRAERLADAWLAWRLYGAPEPALEPDAELLRALEDLLLRLAHFEALQAEPQPLAGAFHPQSGPTLCGGNPFARRSPPLVGPAPATW